MQWVVFFVMAMGNGAGALVAPYRRSASWSERLRIALALAFGFAAVAAPRAIGREWPILSTVMAFGLCASFFRLLAILQRPSSTPSPRLASVVFLLVDARHIPRGPRSLRIDSFISGVVEIAVAVFLLSCIDFLPPVAMYSGAHAALRTVVGATSAYFVVEGTAHVAFGVCALIGVPLGAFHDAPIRSRTLAEFWAKRWNLAVHKLLREMAFRPVARHAGALGGVMAAFAASAVLHFVPIWVAYDARWASTMAAFFLIHGALVVVETKIGVARWPRFFGHAWTLGWFALTLPLFVEPMLRALGR